MRWALLVLAVGCRAQPRAEPAAAPPAAAPAPPVSAPVATTPAAAASLDTDEPPGAPQETRIRPAEARAPARDATSLTHDVVVREIIGSYIGDLRRCYRDELRVAPIASGKLALAFTVGEDGRVTKLAATGIADALDACVQRAGLTWWFPPPKTADGAATTAEFEVTLALAPS